MEAGRLVEVEEAEVGVGGDSEKGNVEHRTLNIEH